MAFEQAFRAAPHGVVGNQGVIPGGGSLPAVMPVAAGQYPMSG
jgi:hypothetical protein